MYGFVALPSRIVEPLIALSIAYVAIENLLTNRVRPWRIALVFGFGLLHGLGFAGVLSDLGLPRGEFLTALLSFNLGVEAGQLTVIAIAALCVYWYRHRTWYHQRVVVPVSLAIAGVGIYWMVERILWATKAQGQGPKEVSGHSSRLLPRASWLALCILHVYSSTPDGTNFWSLCP